jgi:hypothetical protein
LEVPPREASVSLPPLVDFNASDLPPAVPPADKGDGIDLVLTDSMIAPLDSLPKPRPSAPVAPPADSVRPLDNSIDFDLFDPSTEAEIDPKKRK